MTKKHKKIFVRIIISAITCIIASIIPFSKFSNETLAKILKLIAYCIPYFIIGYDVVLGAVKNILHGQVFDEKFLMMIATVGAFAIGEYPEAAGVMLFYQIGELFQSMAVGKSRKSIASLMDIRPDTATVIRDGKEIVVSPEEVELEEIVIIRPGEKIPLDGIIIEGSTSINTAALTGESLPQDKTISDNVMSGTINLSAVIKIKTTSIYEQSTVAKILELVENSSSKKAKVENFITRFAKYYTPVVVISAVILAIIPPLFFGFNWSTWINRSLIFLMVSCPCALVVSVPLSFFGGIGGASKEGILVKGSNYMEVLANINTIVFDKTGTLTKGTFNVTAIHPEKITQAELLDIAAAAESYSTHPVALSIVKAHQGHIEKSRIGKVTEIAGKGLAAEIDGTVYFVGNATLMTEINVSWHNCHCVGTIIHIAKKDEYLGHIVINDELKENAKEALQLMKKNSITKTVMLTGDGSKVAEDIANKVSVDEYYAELLPAQKVEQIEKILDSIQENTSNKIKETKVAFVGDGINDAPVLSRADLGIAMGALGSDAAIESADIVLMDDKLEKIPLAIRIAKKTMRIVKQNIWFALSVKGIILVLSALGLTNMWIAVFGDVGVMVISIINSMRTLRNK